MKLFDKISNSLFFEERLQTMAGEIDESVHYQWYDGFADVLTRH